MRHTFLCCVAALVAACLVAGCQVPRVPVWLPDSSGFILTDEQGGVLRCDAATGQQKSVLAKSSTQTRIPAVSPDGKQVALIRAVPEPAADKVQVLIYDLRGELAARSAEVSWKADAKPGRQQAGPFQSGALWSPSGKHLLFWYLDDSNKLQYGQYDVDSRAVKRLDQVEPFAHVLAFGMSPICDDDRGFLALSKSPSKEDATEVLQDVFLAGWDGRRYGAKTITPEAKAFIKRLVDHLGAENQEVKLEPREENLLVPFPTGCWEKGTAVIQIGGGVFRLDTVKLAVSYESDEQSQARRRKLLAEKIVYRVPFDGGKSFVQCRDTGEKEVARVELVVAGREEPTPLGTVETNYGKAMLGHVPKVAIPSPDGKSVLVTSAGKDGKYYTAAIDAKGNVVGKVPLPWPNQ